MAVTWLMRETKRLVKKQKDYLPNKAKRADEPKIIWIEAPLIVDFPNNEERDQFNKVLNEVGKLQGISVLALKQIWEPDAHNYFIHSALRYTSDGLKQYWEAVDRTIRYMLTSRHHHKNKKTAPQFKMNKQTHNRYIWTNIHCKPAGCQHPPRSHKQMTYEL